MHMLFSFMMNIYSYNVGRLEFIVFSDLPKQKQSSTRYILKISVYNLAYELIFCEHITYPLSI